MAGGLFLVCTGAVVTMVGLATLPVSGPIATGVLGLLLVVLLPRLGSGLGIIGNYGPHSANRESIREYYGRCRVRSKLER